MTHRRLSRVALLMLALLVGIPLTLALLAGILLLPNQAHAQEPSITVRKILVQNVGQQDTPQNRDTSLSGYRITFEVFAGATAAGTAIDNITVTLNQNAQGQGDQGNGSQGTTTSDFTLTAGQVYTVCEIPLASTGTMEVPLTVAPRPTASQGGSTGGQQTQLGTNCITFTQGPGNTVVNFLNQKQTTTTTTTATGTTTRAATTTTAAATTTTQTATTTATTATGTTTTGTTPNPVTTTTTRATTTTAAATTSTTTRTATRTTTAGTAPGPVTGGPSSGGGFAAGDGSSGGGATFATGALALALALASLGVRRRRRA